MKGKTGFTLIELLLVLTIIGILIALAIPQYLGLEETSRVDVSLQNMKMIANAARIYQIKWGTTYVSGEPSIQDLADAGYLFEPPDDPVSGSDKVHYVINYDGGTSTKILNVMSYWGGSGYGDDNSWWPD